MTKEGILICVDIFLYYTDTEVFKFRYQTGFDTLLVYTLTDEY